MVGVFCAVTFVPKASLVLRPTRRSQALQVNLGSKSDSRTS